MSIENVFLGSVLAAMAISAPVWGDIDPIPYPNPGTYIASTYTFTATADGPVMAYFYSLSGAAWTETLGMQVNGTTVTSGVFNNHATAVGTEQNMGNVHAGDTLTFFITIVDSSGAGYDGMNVYSDPTLNTGDYANGYPNHVYATAYSGTGPVPVAGTFVGFEDNTPFDTVFGATDWNYNDEAFVFTNVASAVPEPAALSLLALGGLSLLRRRR